MKQFAQLFLLSAVLLLAACGSKSKLDGMYSDELGATSYTFKSNGKVSISAMGTQVSETNYEVDGNKVKIGPGGNLVMTLQDDGSMQAMGIKFTKQKK